MFNYMTERYNCNCTTKWLIGHNNTESHATTMVSQYCDRRTMNFKVLLVQLHSESKLFYYQIEW